MMKNLIICVLVALFAVGTASAQLKKKSAEPTPPVGSTATATTPASSAKAPKGAMVGKVCTLMSVVSGKVAYPGKDEAMKMANRGEILCVMVGKRACIVLNSDGTNASTKLAAFGGGNVTIMGKMLSRSGMNVLLADSMQ
jgi:hypothetical protein